MQAAIELALLDHWPEQMQTARVFCGCSEIFGPAGNRSAARQAWATHIVSVVVGVIYANTPVAEIPMPATNKATKKR